MNAGLFLVALAGASAINAWATSVDWVCCGAVGTSPQGTSLDAQFGPFNFGLAFPDPTKPQNPFIGITGEGFTRVAGQIDGEPSAPSPVSVSTARFLEAPLSTSGTGLLARYQVASAQSPRALQNEIQLDARGGAASRASYSTGTHILVSPWAVAIYSADVNIDAHVLQLCNGTCDHVDVTGGIQVQLADGTGPITRDAFSFALDGAQGPKDGSLLDQMFSRKLSISFDNSLSGNIPELRLQFDIEAVAYSNAFAPPIPEPPPVALLALGLIGTALHTRHLRRSVPGRPAH